MTDEEKVLEWLVQHKNEGDTIESIENVDMFERLVKDEDDVIVCFLKPKGDKKSDQVLAELEHIDDDAESHEVHMVKTHNPKLAAKYGIEQLPALAYFEDGHPNLYSGDLMDEDKVLEWVLHHKEHETIELVNAHILEALVKDEDYVAALFSELPKSTQNSF